ncbi:TPA: alcohol dehydrogenase catalytic domain-containing protein [Citrobacter braakii]|uniref:alcohol dehydrogenase catalytic domain-containing protein n=1 Tax=Citrobacter braakii TaxID=57706 RepID=UPI0021564A56|nr:alcohol dehydrogenase catalytic domain-containing protein [Citrobacter braakii]
MRVTESVICGSCPHLYRSKPSKFHGGIFGHEFMAEAVETKPEATAASIGDCVVIPFFPDTQEIKWLT